MRFTVSSGDTPCSRSAIAFGPYKRFAAACVATAPTPGFAYGTAAPAANARDCTPTPNSFVAGSKAMIEKVENQGSGEGVVADGSWAAAGATANANANKRIRVSALFMGHVCITRRRSAERFERSG